jgi:hypothetical protein
LKLTTKFAKTDSVKNFHIQSGRRFNKVTGMYGCKEFAEHKHSVHFQEQKQQHALNKSTIICKLCPALAFQFSIQQPVRH